MIAQVNVKAYRPRKAHILPRQRIAGRPSSFSAAKENRAPLAFMVALTMCATLAAGYIFSLQIQGVRMQAVELEQQGRLLADDHVRLKAEYTHLRSESRVQIVAADKLGLYAPGKNQVHHM